MAGDEERWVAEAARSACEVLDPGAGEGERDRLDPAEEGERERGGYATCGGGSISESASWGSASWNDWGSRDRD